ncbi:MAG: hypothetical protein WCG25_07550 [bacterium]
MRDSIFQTLTKLFFVLILAKLEIGILFPFVLNISKFICGNLF